jgi:hypothetical protein
MGYIEERTVNARGALVVVTAAGLIHRPEDY